MSYPILALLVTGSDFIDHGRGIEDKEATTIPFRGEQLLTKFYR